MNKYSADELFKIAYNHLQKKDFRKSADLFEKLINEFPENLSVLRNLTHSYAFLGEFEKAENYVKKIININPDEPFAYQFLASILKDQDKLEEANLIINEGLEKKLINEKWEIQKNFFFPKIAYDRDEIEKYRVKIELEIKKILNANFQKELDYDKDQIIVPPHVDLSYSDWDNLEIEPSVFQSKRNYRYKNGRADDHPGNDLLPPIDKR